MVGHFIKIDLDILCKELQAAAFLECPVVDTAKAYRWLLRKGHYTEDLFHGLENTDLASLAKIYDIDFREAHHALDDAFVTARLWQKLLYQLESHGVRTIGALLKIASP